VVLQRHGFAVAQRRGLKRGQPFLKHGHALGQAGVRVDRWQRFRRRIHGYLGLGRFGFDDDRRLDRHRRLIYRQRRRHGQHAHAGPAPRHDAVAAVGRLREARRKGFLARPCNETPRRHDLVLPELRAQRATVFRLGAFADERPVGEPVGHGAPACRRFDGARLVGEHDGARRQDVRDALLGPFAHRLAADTVGIARPVHEPLPGAVLLRPGEVPMRDTNRPQAVQVAGRHRRRCGAQVVQQQAAQHRVRVAVVLAVVDALEAEHGKGR